MLKTPANGLKVNLWVTKLPLFVTNKFVFLAGNTDIYPRNIPIPLPGDGAANVFVNLLPVKITKEFLFALKKITNEIIRKNFFHWSEGSKEAIIVRKKMLLHGVKRGNVNLFSGRRSVK